MFKGLTGLKLEVFFPFLTSALGLAAKKPKWIRKELKKERLNSLFYFYIIIRRIQGVENQRKFGLKF